MSSVGYEIVRSLGVGALSEALLARLGDGRRVVVKRLHRHLAYDAGCVEMFAHEARVLAALSHPGVARLVAPPTGQRAMEFMQEFAPGLSLHVMAATPDVRMAYGAACEAIAQLLVALDHVHTRRDAAGSALSIVHRDVCPANVIVARDGRVTLVDFGIATSVWRPERDRGVMRGTRGYVAPEVITGERDLDARVDLFAVGVMLYELTVGRRLYEGSAPRVMAAIVDGPQPSPRREVPMYPPRLDAVVQRALAREADARFENAWEMLDALDDALRVDGIARDVAALATAAERCHAAQPRDGTR